MKFDLHMHSCYSSDGEYTPTELIEMGKELGLKVMALCDHNCNLGIDEMIRVGNENGIKVIPAMEFDTKLNGRDVHLLGYNMDYKQPYFNEINAKIEKLAADAMVLRVEKLVNKFGIAIDLEKCIEIAAGKNPFFPVVDMMLKDPKAKEIEMLKPYLPGGPRGDIPAVNFFWDCCGYGSDLFVSVNNPDFKETVDIIHKYGGIAICAHPHTQFYKNEEMLNAALAAGVDGFEAYSNYHDAEENEFYDEFCQKHNLLMTCGSDFHGSRKPTIKMSECGYTKDDDVVLKPFFEALK